MRERRQDARARRADGVAERDARSARVDPFVTERIEPEEPEHGQHLRGERLVQLDDVQIGEREARPRERLLRRRDRTDPHDPRRDPGHRPRTQAQHRAETEPLRDLWCCDDAGGRAVVLAGGVPRGHGRLGVLCGHDRPESGERIEARILTGVLIDRHRRRTTATVRDLDGNELVVEAPQVARRHRPAVRLQREAVLLLPRDAVLPTEVLGGLDHPAGDRMQRSPGGHSREREPVDELDPVCADATPDAVRRELDVAHALRATGDHDIRDAGLDPHGSVEDRLQTRAAPPVDLDAGDVVGQPCVERHHTSQRRRTTGRVALTHDHVVDARRVDTGPVHHRADHRRGERLDRDISERAPEAPDGSPQRRADHDLAHRLPVPTP